MDPDRRREVVTAASVALPRPMVASIVALCVLVSGAWHPSSAHAVADPGASGSRDPAATGAFPAALPGTYRPPVEAPVIDGFRMDAGPYGPGNRGLEYDTAAGTPVRSIGSGRVVFVGPVAGRWAVTVLHPDGRRSSLTGIVSPRISAGALVTQGQVLAVAGERLHLGVREGERYIDPAGLFAATRRRAVLVPLGGHLGA